MKRVAVVDIGSHTSLFAVVEGDGSGAFRVLLEAQATNCLGMSLGVDREIPPGVISKNIGIIQGFLRKARGLKAEKIAAVGTKVLRKATNAGDFIQAVRQELGVDLVIVSGDEEARLGYLGVRTGLGQSVGGVYLIDVGGGSTEVTIGQGELIKETYSLELGAVSLTQKYVHNDPVTQEEWGAMAEYIARWLKERLPPLDQDQFMLFGIGGTLCTLAALDLELTRFDYIRVDGHVLSQSRVNKFLETFKKNTSRLNRALLSFDPDRAGIILAGTTIWSEILKKLGSDKVIVSTRGVRHGVAWQYLNSDPGIKY
ncbi:hypothetical protein ISS37_02235 [candidate division KSB1 bacterium]|nr:hypothetical protein [candidate division KSB1 bacterium]